MNEREKDGVKVLRENPKTKNKKMGFYAALYSCVGLMLVLAVIIGFNRFLGPDPAGEIGADVNRGTTPPITVTPRPTLPPVQTEAPTGQLPAEQDHGAGNVAATPRPQPTPVAQATPTPQPQQNQTDTTLGDDYDYTLPVFGADDPPPWPPADVVLETPDYTRPDYSDHDYWGGGYDYGYVYDSDYVPLGFTAFTDEDRFSWPVLGEIIFDYSTTALIFNPTLNSWRINDNVAIESPAGTMVSAAATGKVTDVTTTHELGKTIVLYHGNGWSTTYSQLQSDVYVRVGDVVERGQTMGYVGTPTRNSSALAPHVAFRVTHNDATVNPRTILALR